MKPIKMLGLAAVAAMAAMVFVGATSASAAWTQLCNSHAFLTCGKGEAAKTLKIVGAEAGVFLGVSLNVKCDTIEGSGDVLPAANPQPIHVEGLNFASCETSDNDACIVLVLQQPLANLNKTGLNLGTLTAASGRVHVECEDIFGSLDIECEYDLAGFQFAVGAQHLDADKTPLNEIGSDFLCQHEPTLDLLLKTTESRYVLG
jgi:hypothetical protein